MTEKMTFHLSGFDGPLDLLLHLIAKNKVSVYDIPISLILEQYMEILRAADSADMEAAGDFIAMSAQLMLIKSRMLLPKETAGDEEDDPRAQLVEQLLEYQRIREVQPYFRACSDAGRDIFTRPPEPPEPYRRKFEGVLPPEKLSDAARRMLTRLGRRMPPPVSAFSGIVGRERVPVHTRITSILLRLRQKARLDFRSLFSDARSRSEIVATFLAVLELSRTHRVSIGGGEENPQLSLFAQEDQEERIS